MLSLQKKKKKDMFFDSMLIMKSLGWGYNLGGRVGMSAWHVGELQRERTGKKGCEGTQEE